MGRRVKINLRYLWKDRDRHGNVRYYVAVPGRNKVRIRQEPGTPKFLEAYNAAIGDGQPGKYRLRASRGTLTWLCQQYFGSGDFKSLHEITRRRRRSILERICEKHGSKPYAKLEPRHVLKLRDEIAEKPEAANGRLKALRQVFRYAVMAGLTDRNPVREVPFISTGSEGFHTWTIEEISQYCEKHPLGTKGRLALDILLYTGARRSDAVLFGRQMVRDGWLNWTEAKGQRRKRKERTIPILPDLQLSLEACPSGHMTWLVTAFGKPFTANGFGNRFRKWCDEAGLPHCSAHGLRKAGAVLAVENGATEDQLKAIYGWQTSKEAVRYTQRASRKKLAGDAMHLIKLPAGEQDRDKNTPTSQVVYSHRGN